MPVVHERRTLRISVVFGGQADEGLSGILSSLVSGRQADVAGVFVEDRSLFRMAELPFAAEVCRVSAVRRPVTTRELERQMKLLALRAEAVVRRVAEGAGTPWSFRRHRGRLSTALAETGEADLVVVGAARHGLVASNELRAIDHTLRAADTKRRRPVAVLFQPSVAGWRAVDAGVDLATRTGRPLVAFTAASAEDVVSEIGARLRALGLERATVQAVPGTDPASLHSAVRRALPAFVVLGVDESDPAQAELEGLQRRLRCPLIIVRSAPL